MKKGCQSFATILSAYADGEGSRRERALFEAHLSGCGDCRERLVQVDLLSRSLRARLEARAQEADFSGFAEKVFQGIDATRPGLVERMRVAFGELMSFHRTAVLASAATAAITLLLAVPFAYWLARSDLEPQVIVQSLELDDPTIQPVVMNMGDGKTLIMLVRQPDAEPAQPQLPRPPSGGDL